jgi:hypothetical protein
VYHLTALVYATRNTNGTWSAPVDLNTGSGVISTRLAVSNEGIVHVIWYQRLDEQTVDGLAQLKYRRMTGNGTWEAQKVLWESKEVYNFQMLAVAANSRLHVVWTENIHWGSTGLSRILYQQQDPQGKWSQQEQVSPVGYTLLDLAASETDDLAILLAQQESWQLFFTERQQNVWSKTFPLSSFGSVYDKANAAFDDTGALHVVWGEIYNPS